MEGIKEVQGKTKRTRPPRGADGGRFTPSPTAFHWKSGTKRFVLPSPT